MNFVALISPYYTQTATDVSSVITKEESHTHTHTHVCLVLTVIDSQ